jgi:hypothetical protein
LNLAKFFHFVIRIFSQVYIANFTFLHSDYWHLLCHIFLWCYTIRIGHQSTTATTSAKNTAQYTNKLPKMRRNYTIKCWNIRNCCCIYLNLCWMRCWDEFWEICNENQYNKNHRLYLCYTLCCIWVKFEKK